MLEVGPKVMLSQLPHLLRSKQLTYLQALHVCETYWKEVLLRKSSCLWHILLLVYQYITPSDFRPFVVEGIKIPNPSPHDFAHALWHHRNIDKTSEFRPFVGEGIKIPNPSLTILPNALWHHRSIDKTVILDLS